MWGPNKSPTLAIASLLLLLVSLPAWAVLSFGDEPQTPAHGHNVSALCREAIALYKKNHERDEVRLVSIFQIFHEIHGQAAPLERKAIVSTLQKAFDIKPFPREAGFLRTAAACLSGMGDEGLDGLIHALRQKSLRNWGAYGDACLECMDLRRTVILAMGYTRAPRALKTLIPLLDREEPTVIKAACQAISCFGFLPLEKKKTIVEKLLKRYSVIHARAEAEARDRDDKKKKYYEMQIYVESSFNDALNKMTFRSFDTAPQWSEWFGVNKDKDKW